MAVNNNNKVKAILSQIQKAKPTKEVELNKTQLSAVSTALTEMDAFRDAELDGVYFAYERADEILDEIYEFQTKISMEVDNFVVNGPVTSLQDTAEVLLEALMQIEDAAEELGVDPNDILDVPSDFGSFDDLKGRVIDASETVYNDARSKYQEIRRQMESGLADFW